MIPHCKLCDYDAWAVSEVTSESNKAGATMTTYQCAACDGTFWVLVDPEGGVAEWQVGRP